MDCQINCDKHRLEYGANCCQCDENCQCSSDCDFCEDCGQGWKNLVKYSDNNRLFYGDDNQPRLMRIPACADYQWDGSLCCTKMVCYEGCQYWCPNGHINEVTRNDGWMDQHTCKVCNVSWQPEFEWFGISIEEFHNRY